MNAQDEKTTAKKPYKKPGERSIVVRVPEDYYRKFNVGRAIQGLSTADYVKHLIDLEAKNPVE